MCKIYFFTAHRGLEIVLLYFYTTHRPSPVREWNLGRADRVAGILTTSRKFRKI